MKFPAPCFLAGLTLLFFFSAACRKAPEPKPDRPRLTSNVAMQDVTFHSAALDRDMPYRVVMPAKIPVGSKLPVVYLLHGGGGDFKEWTNDSDVARFAENNLILVMPEGGYSYYTNSVDRHQDRYEDYIVHDLIADVENRFPAALGRSHRGIVGVSMGGFGAIKLALKYPELFVFSGGISSAIDVPSRPFSIKRISQWREHEAIFGSWGSATRRENDPLVLARRADPTTTPYLFLTCGNQEGLLPSNRQFAALLAQRHVQYEFHVENGGHNWNQWNALLPEVFHSLLTRMPS